MKREEEAKLCMWESGGVVNWCFFFQNVTLAALKKSMLGLYDSWELGRLVDPKKNRLGGIEAGTVWH